MDYVVDVCDLSKNFFPSKGLLYNALHPFQKSKAITALDNITLKIKPGKILGIIGPNGSGKTTLIKILSCLITPSGGEARVCGYDVLKDENAIKLSIGLVSGGGRSFYWRLTLLQNLCFFAALYNLSSRQAKVRISELSSLLEIDSFLDTRFQECSDGVRQKLAIARSLLHDPPVLFMDEPTKNLDPVSVKKLKDFLKQELVNKQGKTIFFISHELDGMESFMDLIAIMCGGHIAAYGGFEELRKMAGLSSSSLMDVYSKILANCV